MAYSTHAIKQAQRRGISLEYAEIINDHGVDVKSNHSCRIRRVPYSEMNAMKYDNPVMWKRYRDKKATTVLSRDNDVITVKHQYRPLWRSGI